MTVAPRRRINGNIERAYFGRFQAAYPMPSGTIAYADKPDVILSGERKIGIEITNFYLQSGSDLGSEQRQKPMRVGIADQAHALYLSGGGRGIELTLAFNARRPISKKRRQELPGELAELAKRNDNRSSGTLYSSIPELSTVWLNAQEYTDAKWRVPGTYNVVPLSAAGLESIVREKEAKSAEYASCDAYWLLVVVEGMDPAQEQEIRVDGLHIPSEIFERVIIYKPGFEHIVEVQT